MGKKKNKAEKKEKEIKKFVKDKTFGMKNKKKSQKVNKMIKGIASQNKGGLEKLQAEKYNEKKRQKEIEKEKKFMGSIFANNFSGKGAVKQKGAKSKPICQFFKAGLCTKGKKCKYSHSIEEEKQEPVISDKINLFKDQREEMFGNEDNIENWNQQKLEEAVNYNAKKYSTPHNQTSIICKFFLTAVEKMTYGWFWKCPNGYSCKFRHALPPGFKFKPKTKPGAGGPKVDSELMLIKEIDAQRDKLESGKCTPVTYEKFMKWVQKRREKKKKEREERIKKFLKDRGLKIKKFVTGKQLFEKNQGLFQDAEGAVGKKELKQKEENVEVDENVFGDDEVPDF
jgi:hypothetical protein